MQVITAAASPGCRRGGTWWELVHRAIVDAASRTMARVASSRRWRGGAGDAGQRSHPGSTTPGPITSGKGVKRMPVQATLNPGPGSGGSAPRAQNPRARGAGPSGGRKRKKCPREAGPRRPRGHRTAAPPRDQEQPWQSAEAIASARRPARETRAPHHHQGRAALRSSPRGRAGAHPPRATSASRGQRTREPPPASPRPGSRHVPWEARAFPDTPSASSARPPTGTIRGERGARWPGRRRSRGDGGTSTRRSEPGHQRGHILGTTTAMGILETRGTRARLND